MGFLFIVQVIVCVLLIGTVMLQVGRGSSTGAVFGGGTGAFFGPSGEASFLGKVIVVLAIAFAVNTVVLYISSRRAPPPMAPSAQETSCVPSGEKSLRFALEQSKFEQLRI